MDSMTKHEARQQAALQRKKDQAFTLAGKKLQKFTGITIAVLAFVLILFFVNFAEVYNADAGVEVKVSGWSFLVAGLTGNYSSFSSVYGDLAVPFYYYASAWCPPIATGMIVAAAAVLIALALEIVAAVKKLHSLRVPVAVLAIAACAALIVCYAQGVGMNASDILPVYCQGNPACVVRSYALFPAVVSLGAAGVECFAAVKYFKARKERDA